jgi:hypothetical protein
MELTAIHYFYIHPNFTFLTNHALFANYFSSTRQFLLHIHPYGSPALALLTLALYPTVILLTILIKKFGPNKIIVPIVQIAVFLYPLLWIKVII